MTAGTILVYYDGSEPADALLRLACWLHGAEGHVVALYCTRIPNSLPLEPLPSSVDREGNEALDHAELVAMECGVEIETWLTRVRRPADAILTEACVHNVEAIFLPMLSWRHPWCRLLSAYTRRAVLRRAVCPVLVGRWAIPNWQRINPASSSRVAMGT